MTIEQKINTELFYFNVPRINLVHLENWKWDGQPRWSWDPHNTIHDMIREADASECLTSNSEYIRECKKWFMGNE